MVVSLLMGSRCNQSYRKLFGFVFKKIFKRLKRKKSIKLFCDISGWIIFLWKSLEPPPPQAQTCRTIWKIHFGELSIKGGWATWAHAHNKGQNFNFSQDCKRKSRNFSLQIYFFMIKKNNSFSVKFKYLKLHKQYPLTLIKAENRNGILPCILQVVICL